ncbi:MAG: helix-turn-helix domain-containing protein [Spirochaetota bacterium]
MQTAHAGILPYISALPFSMRPVIQIAYSVGFESLSTFSRAFSRNIGMTPSDWREKHSGNGAKL